MKKTEDLEDIKVHVGQGNVWADLGYKNHEEMATKANLVIELGKIIKKRKLTQTEAAEIIGLSQPKLSELLGGHFKGYSSDRLMHYLNELGQDIDIVVRPKPRNRKARISVFAFINRDIQICPSR